MIKHIEVEERTHREAKVKAAKHGLTLKKYISELVKEDIRK